ncbi:Cu_bind_like domain-containing protein, partial [Cephalotus follicularis]
TALVATMVLLFVLLHCDVAHAKTWIVGDEFGWDMVIDEEVWPQGKTFYAGDVLVFNYDYQRSNVVAVNRTGYITCTANEGATTYNSGADHIPLGHGQHYFIDTYYEPSCAAGMKIAIFAKA